VSAAESLESLHQQSFQLPTSSSPTTDSKQSQSPLIKINHAKPMFPSVLHLLEENGISPDHVKGTGVWGMLMKGDVLAFLGQASSPTGTWKAVKESPIPKTVPKPMRVCHCPFY
jgi:pyruvate/2-oxoglutarate dehydrogenase complex dihydrolipoamide acyltransferase (E2) component